MIQDKNKRLILILQIAVLCVFIGRGWQHLVWDAPYRTLLWDEGWIKGIVEGLFTIPWQDYITSPRADENIQNLIKGFGWFYIVCAFSVFFIKKWQKVSGFFMVAGSISLIILAMLYCKERFFSVGQFLEYALQFSAPLFLYYVVRKEVYSNRFIFFVKLAIALTFVCHGLYAIGYYPRPGYFTEMTINILHVEESTAITILKIAGILDFVIGVGIFLPWRIAKWIVLYAILWGFLTTVSRVWAYVELAYFLETAKQWVHETVYRFPHFLVPLFLFLKEESKLKS